MEDEQAGPPWASRSPFASRRSPTTCLTPPPSGAGKQTLRNSSSALKSQDRNLQHALATTDAGSEHTLQLDRLRPPVFWFSGPGLDKQQGSSCRAAVQTGTELSQDPEPQFLFESGMLSKAGEPAAGPRLIPVHGHPGLLQYAPSQYTSPAEAAFDRAFTEYETFCELPFDPAWDYRRLGEKPRRLGQQQKARKRARGLEEAGIKPTPWLGCYLEAVMTAQEALTKERQEEAAAAAAMGLTAPACQPTPKPPHQDRPPDQAPLLPLQQPLRSPPAPGFSGAVQGRQQDSSNQGYCATPGSISGAQNFIKELGTPAAAAKSAYSMDSSSGNADQAPSGRNIPTYVEQLGIQAVAVQASNSVASAYLQSAQQSPPVPGFSGAVPGRPQDSASSSQGYCATPGSISGAQNFTYFTKELGTPAAAARAAYSMDISHIHFLCISPCSTCSSKRGWWWPVWQSLLMETWQSLAHDMESAFGT